MKILQFGKFYPPDIGGIESVMQDITESLNVRKIHCDVLCANSALQYKEEVLACGAKIMRCASFGKLASTAIAPQMISKIREVIGDYDIIHIHLPDPMASIALLCANYNDKKIILHWHSDIIRQKNLLKFYLPFQNKILRISDAIIATSQKYIIESAFLPPYKDKCHCIPIGIDERVFALEDPASRTAFEAVPKNKKIIFSLGRLTRKKGFEYLIESAKYISDDYVVCIGGGGDEELKNELEKLIAFYSLEKKVFLLGPIDRDKLYGCYKQSHIFVLPSLQESYGLVLVEAMCAKLPLVSTNLSPSGINWINQHGSSGIVVEPRNAKAIAEAILVIDERYEFFSLNAYNRFKEYFTQDKIIEAIINLYKSLLR